MEKVNLVQSILRAVREGDSAEVRRLLNDPRLPQTWILQHGEGAIALASGHGHYELMQLLRAEMAARAQSMATSDAGAHQLQAALENSLQFARYNAATTAAEHATSVPTDARARPLDPLRRMMADESDGQSTARSGCSSARSSAGGRSARRWSRRRQKWVKVRDGSESARSEFTDDELQSDLDDALDDVAGLTDAEATEALDEALDFVEEALPSPML